MMNQVLHGDCREVLKTLPPNSFDSVVTDPPSGIAFLGLDWDSFDSEGDEVVEGHAELIAFQNFLVEVFNEVYRVLKPGGFGLVWALPRSSHHTMMALERCGFEIRDVLCHAFGQGFKKGLDVSKKFDQLAGAKRKVVGTKLGMPGYSKAKEANPGGYSGMRYDPDKECEVTAPETENAKKWNGYHTGLKPAVEFWILIRKPLEGTVIENLLKYEVGALNIDASRVFTDWDEPDRPDTWKNSGYTAKPDAEKVAAPPGNGINCHPLGRWPADFILSHSPGCKRVGAKVVKGDPRGDCNGTRPGGFYSPGSASGDGKPNAHVYGDQEIPVYECVEGCPVDILNGQSGMLKSGDSNTRRKVRDGFLGKGPLKDQPEISYGDSGGASRFFKVFDPEYESNFIYQAKPSTTEKNADLDEGLINEHKTVKSLKLMIYLVRLVTPEGGTTLDPFAGSGTTLVAAADSGFGFLGIEKDDKTWPVLESRVLNALKRSEDRSDLEDMRNIGFELESE